MQAAQTPMTTGAQKLRPRSGRTPLQPKNCPANPIQDSLTKTKLKQEPIQICVTEDSNKENHPILAAATPTKLEPIDSSLAEELSAIKKKLERLRIDKEKTEKMLKERATVLDLKIKEMEEKGQIQKELEIEVDRLFRLKELKSRCMRVSPIRTLREKEQGKIINDSPSQMKIEESMDECELQSPNSVSSSSEAI
ncbi:hypothetical protein L6164_002501 [Bauhinia variegata]|uniref:Uncharacterized protein n=1 Tax=Bauhinia variegata TaxID=167791 RepID=A0ACB9PXU9_BAUVA|nr:hypothetical protein L6164_002501 [Bauhinia variegata]